MMFTLLVRLFLILLIHQIGFVQAMTSDEKTNLLPPAIEINPPQLTRPRAKVTPPPPPQAVAINVAQPALQFGVNPPPTARPPIKVMPPPPPPPTFARPVVQTPVQRLPKAATFYEEPIISSDSSLESLPSPETKSPINDTELPPKEVVPGTKEKVATTKETMPAKVTGIAQETKPAKTAVKPTAKEIKPVKKEPKPVKPVMPVEVIPEPVTQPEEVYVVDEVEPGLPDLELGSFIEDMLGEIPANVKKQLNKIVLKNPEIEAEADDNSSRFLIRGVLELFGVAMRAEFQAKKDERPAVSLPNATARERLENENIKEGYSRYLKIAMPPNWNIRQWFPELDNRYNFDLSNAFLILSNDDYQDKSLNDFPVKVGLNLVAQVPLTGMQVSPQMKSITALLGNLVNTLIVSALLQKDIKKSLFRAYIPVREDKEISLASALPLDRMMMPESLKKSLRTIKLSKPTMTLELGLKEQKFDLYGSATLFGGEVIISASVIKNSEGVLSKEDLESKIVLKIEMPKEWHFSTTFPELKALDKFVLPGTTLIYSNYEHKDPDYAVKLGSGLNIISRLNMEDDLAMVREALDKLAPQKFGKYKPTTFILTGLIASDITKSHFEALIPLGVTFDFLDSYQRGVIKEKPTAVNKLSIDTLVVRLQANGQLGIGSNVVLNPVGAETSLIFNSILKIAPDKAAFAGAMEGTWKDALGIKWFDLNDPAVEIEFDYGILAALLLPSGLGIRGNLILGQAPDRTSADIAAKASISSVSAGEFIFSGKISSIDLGQLIGTVNRMSSKPIPQEKLPVIQFRDIELTVVPQEATIAGKTYAQGVVAKCKEMIIGGLKGGFLAALNADGFIGEGVLYNFKIPGLSITGPGLDNIPGTEDDGAIVKIRINKESKEFLISGSLDIEFLGIYKQDFTASLDDTALTINLDANIFNKFQAILKLKVGMAPESVLGTGLEGTLRQTALRSLEKILYTAATDFIAQSRSDIDKAKRDVEKLDEEINKARSLVKEEYRQAIANAQTVRKSVKTGAQKEADKTITKISELEIKLDRAKDCFHYPKDCLLAGAYGIELAANKVYLEGLLKPGSKAVEGLIETAEMLIPSDAKVDLDARVAPIIAAKAVAIGVLQFAQNAAGGIGKFAQEIAKGIGTFNIEEVSFSGDMQDFLAGKLPKVTFKGKFLGKERSFKDLQFDFAHPVQSARKIVKKLAEEE